MALKVNYTHSEIGTTIADAYIKVDNVVIKKPPKIDMKDFPDPITDEAKDAYQRVTGFTYDMKNGYIDFDVYIYASESVRNREGTIALPIIPMKIPFDLSLDKNPIKLVYAHIKTLAEFDGAEDVD